MTTPRIPLRMRIGRVLAALLVVAAWMVVAAIGGPTFGTISDVTNNDQASYLPASSDSTKVQSETARFRGSDTTPAVVLYVRSGGLTSDDRTHVSADADRFRALAGIDSAAGPIPSDDGKALELIVQVRTSADGTTVIDRMRDELADHRRSGLESWVTGPAALGVDFGAGFAGIDGTLLLVALAAVFVILLVVYRAVLLPIVVLLTSAFALTASILAVYAMAKADWITVTGQSRGILAILAIGAATDYSLLLVSRYRDTLRVEPDRWRALGVAWRRSIAPISASAATVILGVLCLGFSDLNSNRGLGPVAAVAIGCSYLAAVTALPAGLALFGRAAFWPIVPRYDEALAAEGGDPSHGRLWSWVARAVRRRPRAIWIVTAVMLGALATGLVGLQASGVAQTELLLTPSQSVAGQKELARHYDAGSGSPLEVTAPRGSASEVLATIRDVPHVRAASAFTGVDTRPGGTSAPAKVVDGRVLIEATLSVAADSDAAERSVQTARDRLAEVAPSARVGGPSAVALDTNTAAQRDLRVIIPLVLAVIFVVLVLLLRALVAPVLLILSVALSYAATLGTSALLFDGVFRFPGADPSVPLFGFVFLVALGVDYNIFLMSRVREEALRTDPRSGVALGLVATGGMITSAGIVLAATFAALSVIPILFLVQIAFIVAFGVLLDTFLVRSLLVPALAMDLGRAFWWPSTLSRRRRHAGVASDG